MPNVYSDKVYKMNDKVLQELARVFATIIKEHGVETALAALPEDVYWKLYTHFAEIERAPKS